LRKLNPDDFKNLFACANLNIVIPFIRSKIYRFTRESSEKSTIDYADEITLKHEINDIIVTHLSLPVISNQAHDSRPWLKSVVNRLRTNKPVNPTFYFDYISEQYKASENSLKQILFHLISIRRLDFLLPMPLKKSGMLLSA
jgi:hypothetical protein